MQEINHKIRKNTFQPEIKHYFLQSRFLRREGYPIQLKQDFPIKKQ